MRVQILLIFLLQTFTLIHFVSINFWYILSSFIYHHFYSSRYHTSWFWCVHAPILQFPKIWSGHAWQRLYDLGHEWSHFNSHLWFPTSQSYFEWYERCLHLYLLSISPLSFLFFALFSFIFHSLFPILFILHEREFCCNKAKKDAQTARCMYLILP